MELRLGHMKFVMTICMLAAFSGFAQPEKPMNYRRFDEKTFHFGFMLGVNSSDLTLLPRTDAYEQYGVESVINQSGPGGQVGPVITMKLGHPVVRLRFIPTLSFQERKIDYVFVDDTYTGTANNSEQISMTNLDFPLMLQFRTLRYNNFAAYTLLGAQYSLDLQSQEEASQSFTDPFIKLKQHDWQGQVGVGVEFFATYFKFGIEVKFSHGFANSFINDNTVISRPIDKTYNRVWWLSFIFEG